MSDWGCSKKSPYSVLPSVLFIVLLSDSEASLASLGTASHKTLRSGRRPQGDPSADASGRQQGSLHKLLKQTHVRLAHLFEFNNIIRNKWRRI